MRLYHVDLGDPARGVEAGLRVLAAEPGDARRARVRSRALAGPARPRRRVGARARRGARDAASDAAARPTRSARSRPSSRTLAGERLGDRATAERAWLAVLEVEPDAADAFDALAATLPRRRSAGPICARCSSAAPRSRSTSASRLDVAARSSPCSRRSARRAGARGRRVSPRARARCREPRRVRRRSIGSTRDAKQWPELEELLARQADHVHDADAAGRARVPARRAVRAPPRRAGARRRSARGRDRRASAATPTARELLEELLAEPKAGSRHDARRARCSSRSTSRTSCGRTSSRVLRAQRALVDRHRGGRAARADRDARGDRARAAPRNAFDAWLEVLDARPGARARARRAVAARAVAAALARGDRRARGRGRRDAGERRRPRAPRCSASSRRYYDTQLGDARARDRRVPAAARGRSGEPGDDPPRRRRARAPLRGRASSWPELRDDHAPAGRVGRGRGRAARAARARRRARGGQARATAPPRSRRGATCSHDQPTDAGALHALERLYQAAEKWRELIDVLRRKLDAGVDRRDAIALLARIAEIHEHQLERARRGDRRVPRGARSRRRRRARARRARAAVSRRRAPRRPARRARAPGRSSRRRRATRARTSRSRSCSPARSARPVEALDRWAHVLARRAARTPTALGARRGRARRSSTCARAAAEILRPVYDGDRRRTSGSRSCSLRSRRVDRRSGDEAARARRGRAAARAAARRQGRRVRRRSSPALRHAATEPELAQRGRRDRAPRRRARPREPI